LINSKIKREEKKGEERIKVQSVIERLQKNKNERRGKK
jgi:hypothetical protein